MGFGKVGARLDGGLVGAEFFIRSSCTPVGHRQVIERIRVLRGYLHGTLVMEDLLLDLLHPAVDHAQVIVRLRAIRAKF